jgi:transcriptional regulator with XRE-family HTH domain
MPKQITQFTSVDENVGMQIQRRRKFLGISESFLTEALGLTLIEYRKCEIGERRVGAEGLLKLAELLEVSPAFFFEGDPGEIELLSCRGDSTLQ